MEQKKEKLTKEEIIQWCEGNEKFGWELMVNAFSGKTFQKMEQNPKYCQLDYSTSAITEGELKAVYSIEFKNRSGQYPYVSDEIKRKQGSEGYYSKTFKCGGIAIEPEKYCHLMMEHQFKGKIPLYVCYFKDEVFCVFNLLKLKHEPKYDPQRRIKTSYETGGEVTRIIEGRFFLDYDDAIWIKKNGDRL